MSAANWIHFKDSKGEVRVAALRGVDARRGETDMPLPAGRWRARVVLRSGQVLTGVELSTNQFSFVEVVLPQAVEVEEWAGARLELEAIS